jgi:uncharacterized protein YecE (DUF72 family)
VRHTRRGEVVSDDVPAEARDAAFAVFQAALAPLTSAGKLGYVLFQLAPWVHFAPDTLGYVTSLPARLPGATVAVEFRHRSWLPDHGDAVLAALREVGIAHVVVDAPAVPNAVPRIVRVTGPVAVVRLHGRHARGWMRQLRGEEPTVREKYDYLYSEDELRALLPDVEALAEEAEETYVLFNNNNRDYPVRNALSFRRLLGQPVREWPTAPSLPGDLFA